MSRADTCELIFYRLGSFETGGSAAGVPDFFCSPPLALISKASRPEPGKTSISTSTPPPPHLQTQQHHTTNTTILWHLQLVISSLPAVNKYRFNTNTRLRILLLLTVPVHHSTVAVSLSYYKSTTDLCDRVTSLLPVLIHLARQYSAIRRPVSRLTRLKNQSIIFSPVPPYSRASTQASHTHPFAHQFSSWISIALSRPLWVVFLRPLFVHLTSFK